MEYLTGKTEKKTLGIQDILAGEYEGKEVTVNGAVHKISYLFFFSCHYPSTFLIVTSTLGFSEKNFLTCASTTWLSS